MERDTMFTKSLEDGFKISYDICINLMICIGSGYIL